MTIMSQQALQKALYQKLAGDTTLAALVSGVYDRVPEGTAYPYLAIGDAECRDWSTKTTNGCHIHFTLHAFSRNGGKKQVLGIMERVHTLLHDGSLTMAGHTLVMMRFEQSEAQMLPDGITWYGIMRFKALTEAE